jgi:hypothetical protein
MKSQQLITAQVGDVEGSQFVALLAFHNDGSTTTAERAKFESENRATRAIIRQAPGINDWRLLLHFHGFAPADGFYPEDYQCQD